jgi:hypothetical protein
LHYTTQLAMEELETVQPGRRPKGALNKTARDLRQMISNFLMENFEEVQKSFKEIPPKEKIKVYCNLLAFAVPKLRPSDELMLERLSDEELNELLEKLKEAANRQLSEMETG